MIAKLKTWSLALFAAIAGILYLLRLKTQKDQAQQEQKEAKERADHMTRILEEKEKYYKKAMQDEKQPAYKTDDANSDGDITLKL